MARLALAVGYTSRGNSRSEEPRLLYLGTSFQEAKAALAALPEGIGYGEAYRLDGGPNKRFHAPAEAPAAEALNTELPDFLAAAEPEAPEAPAPDEAPAEDSAPEPEGLAKVVGKKK